MPYTIDARLEHGTPALTLIDTATGEKRLQWHGDDENAWKELFRRLVLLSCADRTALVQRSGQAPFGTECLTCGGCLEPPPPESARPTRRRPPT